MLILSRSGISARRNAAGRAGRLAIALAVGVFAAALILRSEEAASAGREALALCGRVLVPSLLPFFILSSLCLELGFAAGLERGAEALMRRFFALPGCCAAPLILGLVGGYPVGARSASQLYARGDCTKDEAHRLLRFCNNSGPAFIFGAAGAGAFGSARAGFVLFVTHLLAALAVGFLSSLPRRNTPKQEPVAAPKKAAAVPFSEAFTGAVTGAARALVEICGFVVFFAVALALLRSTGLFALFERLVSALLSPMDAAEMSAGLVTGFFELTSGIMSLRGASAATGARLSAAAFILGWGGLSVHCQTAAALSPAGLGEGGCAAGKLLQGIIAAALTRTIIFLFPDFLV